MPGPPAYPLLIFFDGACSVCAKEMTAYRRRDRLGRLAFVDISTPGFDPAQYGIPLTSLLHELHAIDANRRVYRGVAAFGAIWQALPESTRFGLLGVLINLPGIHLLARLAYWCFARIRRYLPKRRDECLVGRCRPGTDSPDDKSLPGQKE